MLVLRTLLIVSSCSLALLGCSGEIELSDPSSGARDASGGGGGGGSTFDAASGGSSSTPDASLGNPSDIYDQARQACVDRINAFRATEGKPPLARWMDNETCSDAQAKADGDSNSPHGNFGQCGENAQNTCPGWGSTGAVVQGCLQSMWDEGPGEPFSEHGHYINMSSTRYSQVACGFYKMSNGSIWASQNFR